jgi:phage gp46-like protein
MTTLLDQQGDVRLQQTLDGGDITLEQGLVVMSGGLETAAYLSLFGGNRDDPGGADETFSWWGNLIERVPEKRYRSEVQAVLRGLPATTGNLLRVENAARRDLAWMVRAGAAEAVGVLVLMPAPRRVQIDLEISATAGNLSLRYLENWGAA